MKGLKCKAHIPAPYEVTDSLFSTYRRTYTMELSNEELEIVREKVMEAFKMGLSTSQQGKCFSKELHI